MLFVVVGNAIVLPASGSRPNLLSDADCAVCTQADLAIYLSRKPTVCVCVCIYIWGPPWTVAMAWLDAYRMRLSAVLFSEPSMKSLL